MEQRLCQWQMGKMLMLSEKPAWVLHQRARDCRLEERVTMGEVGVKIQVASVNHVEVLPVGLHWVHQSQRCHDCSQGD